MVNVWVRLILLLLFGLAVTAATEVYSIGLPKDWEQTVIFIEYQRIPGKPCLPRVTFDTPDEEKTALEYCPVGTGFLMRLCGNELLFSNKHIFSLQSEFPLFIRATNKAGRFVRLPINKSWHGHPHPSVDVAAARIDVPPGHDADDISKASFNEDGGRGREKPTSFLVKLQDLRVGDNVLLVGYPSSIPNILEILQTYDAPIFRAGIVSQKFPGVTRIRFREGKQQIEKELKDIFLIDAWSFPGNSGSPVFLEPTMLRYGEDRAQIDLSRPHIIGIQGATITNTGLSIVYAADAIEETAAQVQGAQCAPPLPVNTEKK